MNVLDKNNYKDFEKTYQQIIQEKERINGWIIKIGMEYINKISGSLKNNELFDLNNSLTLRLESMFFHYDLLSRFNISGQEKKLESIGPRLAINITLKQEFLFDSIIFNSISFFDYLSCLLSFIIFKNKRSQWQSIANNSRNKINFKDTKLAKAVDKSDRLFVSKLNQYRSEVIHYNKDNAGFSTSFNLKEGTEKIVVIAPYNFTKKFKKEFVNFDKKDLDLNTVTIWILGLITGETLNILSEMENYIETNRIIKEGKEIIKFKKN